MKIRRSNTRGYVSKSWQNQDTYQSWRSFSCMSYEDPEYLGFGPLLTINDDTTQPGFITTWHEHKNLDIINYMIKGHCRHVDSLGNDNVAGPGQIQHFWCGESIWHHLTNDSDSENRYLQIWIEPNTVIQNTKPSYQFINRNPEFSKLPIDFKNNKIEVWAGDLNQHLVTSNMTYILVLEGSCKINNEILNAGDAVELYTETLVQPINQAHIILFELL